MYLRQEKSLPKIRRAVATLRNLEASEWTHLANYRLISTRTTIVVQTPSGDLLDLEKQPGTVLNEALMRDVLAPFKTRSGRLVPALGRPRPRIRTGFDPEVLGGYPVISGSRVPFDVIAQLAEDKLDSAEIAAIYPSVESDAVTDATAFAKQVAAAA